MSGISDVLVVIGPSGCGKSSVVRLLTERGVLRIHPTWTTRPPRPDESGGSPEHRFVSEAEFDQLCEAGFFTDTVAMFGLPYRYGLPAIERSGDGRIDTVMLRAPLVDRFRAVCPQFRVFHFEDTPDRAAERLRARGATADDFAARMADNDREVALGRSLADRVFVNDSTLTALADAVAGALAGASA